MRVILTNYKKKWIAADPALRAFIAGIFLLGIGSGILSSSFNNYLNDRFGLSASERGFLEFPRELPGFLVIVVTGLLAAFSLRSWAVIVGAVTAVGLLGLGFASPSIVFMTFWMMIWSLAEHLFMPVESAMGLHLAHEGKQGKRLGQISGSRNLAMILGSGIVWLFATLRIDNIYSWLFLIGAVVSVLASIVFLKVHVEADKSLKKRRFVIRPEYKIFYLLNILFGARKQIFLTFAPWVLVTVYGAGPDIIAVLMMIAALAGVVFRQAFGILTDMIGERKMFMADAAILLVVCAGFAFSKNVYILYALFIIDNLMFATRIARTTYLNKIALHKSDIAATLSVGITMDHAVSMTIPFFGGLLWSSMGYSYVFIAASAIAVAGFITSLFVKEK